MSLLIRVLSTPEQLHQLTQAQWQTLLTEAYASQLVGRVYYLATRQNCLIPDYVQWHFTSAYKIAEKQKQQAKREFIEVSRSLAQLNTTLAFLKGAAYIAKGLSCSYGRTFSDIDVLVEQSELIRIERMLKFNDWHQSEIDDYDDKYYRIWMHEIPPLYHSVRGTVLDVHHNILPLTNKHSPNVEQFEFQSVTVTHNQPINILADTDLVIHTAVHLFTESEFNHSLRDLSDLDLLLKDFLYTDELFINKLISRANQLGLSSYVWLALRYSSLILSTPIPSQLLTQLDWQPRNNVHQWLLDFCFTNAFKVNHSSCRNWQTKIALHLLYWRGHLLKMPITILIPHLAKKLMMRIKDIFTKEDEQPLIP